MALRNKSAVKSKLSATVRRPTDETFTLIRSEYSDEIVNRNQREDRKLESACRYLDRASRVVSSELTQQKAAITRSLARTLHISDSSSKYSPVARSNPSCTAFSSSGGAATSSTRHIPECSNSNSAVTSAQPLGKTLNPTSESVENKRSAGFPTKSGRGHTKFTNTDEANGSPERIELESFGSDPHRQISRPKRIKESIGRLTAVKTHVPLINVEMSETKDKGQQKMRKTWYRYTSIYPEECSDCNTTEDTDSKYL